MAQFAKDTTVSVEKSRAEIERLIVRYGATSTAFMNAPDRAMIMFEASGRRVVFELPLPSRNEKQFTHYKMRSALKQRSAAAAETVWEQSCRQRWRALALVIKAKLEAVQSGITTFENEFLAHIMMPDGQTVGSHVKPTIEAWYASGKIHPLLPAPSK